VGCVKSAGPTSTIPGAVSSLERSSRRPSIYHTTHHFSITIRLSSYHTTHHSSLSSNNVLHLTMSSIVHNNYNEIIDQSHHTPLLSLSSNKAHHLTINSIVQHNYNEIINLSHHRTLCSIPICDTLHLSSDTSVVSFQCGFSC